MIHQIGTSESYQQWADHVDDDSYAFEEFLPYFRRSTNWTAPSALRTPNATARYNESAFMPEGGPLQISYPDYAQPFSTWLDGPMSEVGIPLTDDFHSGVLEGAKFCEITINPTTKLRDSSETSYLVSAATKPGLTVLTYSMAERIVFDDLRATGVIVNGTKIPARKEVIIAAGTFQSPQILMLSGIGPAAHLTQHSIPVLLDKPGVGQDMADHIFFGPSYVVNLETYAPTSRVQAAISLFTANQTGPLQNNNADYIAFERLPEDTLSSFTTASQSALSAYPVDWPEVEYFAIGGFFGNFSSSLLPPPNNGNYATILAGLVKPTSRGTVTLASSDFRDLPLINPNWLTTEADQEVAVAAYKRVRQIFATEAMRPVLMQPGVEAFPGLDVAGTDEEILEVIRNTLATIWHAAGTCRMGKRSDPMAVVDSQAKVIGTEGLRVVDASAFALLPPGHPQSTVYALAEKIAQGILDES
jgi:choline dehydrogenase